SNPAGRVHLFRSSERSCTYPHGYGLERCEFAGWGIPCTRQPTCHSLIIHARSKPYVSLSRLTRMLRRRRGSKREFALPNQHQIPNVNKRVREIRENPNWIAPENKVNAHEHASGNAPVPERDGDNALSLSL